MRRTLQLTAAISLAATLALPAFAYDEHHGDHGNHGPPGNHGGPPPGNHGGPQYGDHRDHRDYGDHRGDHRNRGDHGHMGHVLGDRGYSFRGAGGGRREIRLFSPREHEIWVGGHWHHEMRFGRMGYWYEVNGAWYFYDQPFDGPPAYVSEVEFFDPDLGPPDVVVAPPAVVVAPPPAVIVVPPAICVGPLCVR